MKKLLSVFFVIILTVSALLFPASALETDGASLSLQYKSGEILFEGLEIRTFRVAALSPDGTYELTDTFKNYPVSIYGITSQSEWNTVASTLSSYIAADGISADHVRTTDINGTAIIEDIESGLYLMLAVKAEHEDATYTFDCFLTAVAYDEPITAYPKASLSVVGKEKAEYSVLKQWKDGGFSERPDSVIIDIFKDGELYSTKTLSSENNWYYAWSASDESTWHVVERNVPDGYTVTVTSSGNDFIVTNCRADGTSNTPGGKAPQTGDMSATLPFIITMSASGALTLLIAIWRKRTEA